MWVVYDGLIVDGCVFVVDDCDVRGYLFYDLILGERVIKWDVGWYDWGYLILVDVIVYFIYPQVDCLFAYYTKLTVIC